ncbi:FAD:protein FMN transferase [Tranquillimonas alkanivorans]|uniref:FAD:protein FMN transferase n=1 Tax=Tranquillimonas alkanivorans TaxID=441119 RepID=A0A1I5U376_9RHOB|nr:FAD:protein FMN transferase [Tranquillimonas alkanivorans]SFP89742.1 thiamine biosynthesis lipoprotein [Tranquillimonas alkanivorans]
MQLTRRTLLIGAAALIATPGWASATRILGGRAFASTWRAVLPADADAQAAAALVAHIVAETDAAMSPWRADSEVSRFNRSASLDWSPASANLCAVVDEAERLRALTSGAFDARVGPLVARYGFGPIRDGVPAGDAVVREGELRKTATALTLDLCGIAKGHALDRIVRALADAGLDTALVELGGEVHALGSHPEGRPWQIAVERPGASVSAQRIVAPGRLALATSGHVAQGHAGRAPLTHIIDPRSAHPADQALLSVSVLAPTAMRADALATALAAAGPVAGPVMARDLGLSALFLRRASGEIVETMTGDFAAHVTG